MPGEHPEDSARGTRYGLRSLLFAAGAVAAVSAAAADAGAARAAASQDWPPFVLVAGLLLIGLVASRDGLFAAAGAALARAAPGGRRLFAGSVALVVLVTAVLNLDTSVAFLSPVLAHTSRRRGDDGTTLLAACLLLSNAGSLLLPGSNLTNLIVLGHLHLSGGSFAARMAAPWAAAVVATAAVIAVGRRKDLMHNAEQSAPAERPAVGLGLVGVIAAAVLVVVLRQPALPVAAVGIAIAGAEMARRRIPASAVRESLGSAVLVGLFGIAVGLGAAGRDWSGPARFMSHLNPWATAGVSAVASVVMNNLPAASLLAARVPAHPLSLLIGLNLGPNLFVTGSLSWILWIRASRSAGVEPPVARTVRIGAVAVPVAIVAAVGALLLGVSGT